VRLCPPGSDARPPFSKLDLIVCRNVLIYLGPILQRRLMSVFHYALKPNGFLMLGSAETIGTYLDLFSAVDKRHKIYMKRPGVARADMEFPLGPALGREEGGKKSSLQGHGTTNVQNEANRIVLTRFSPPAVLVDSDLKIVQFRGQTGMFLEPAPGEASLDLLKMAREGLLFGLRAAVAEARKKDAPARRKRLRVRHNGAAREVTVEVIPISIAGEGRYFLVLFESDLASRTPDAEPPTPGKAAKARLKRRDDRAARLEQELAASREYLQSLIQDLEAANAELQSANEEILSANEELQSTNEELDTAKEELQSTNEELNTVNEELHARNEELSRVNSDLLNLLGSVQIAIVMVTNDLRIRRFTPMAERVLNLIPTDIGRPIGDIKPNIDCPELEKMIAEAIDSVNIRESQCHDRHGNPLLLRIRPYKNVENRIDGAVLALFDLSQPTRPDGVNSDLKAAATNEMVNPGIAEPLSRQQIEAILDTARRPMVVLDGALRVNAVNNAFCRTFGTSSQACEGKTLYELSDGRWDSAGMRRLLEEVLPRENKVEQYPLDFPLAGGKNQTMLVSARRTNRDGAGTLISLAIDPPQPV